MHSLNGNNLCGVGWNIAGTYTVEGITKLLEALKGSSVTYLRCACRPKAFTFVSAPIDAPTLSPIPILPLARSLGGNSLGGAGHAAARTNGVDRGVFKTPREALRGAFVIAAVLNETKITALECTAAPLRDLRTLVSSLPLHVHPVSERTHSFLGPFRSISFLGPS